MVYDWTLMIITGGLLRSIYPDGVNTKIETLDDVILINDSEGGGW